MDERSKEMLRQNSPPNTPLPRQRSDARIQSEFEELRAAYRAAMASSKPKLFSADKTFQAFTGIKPVSSKANPEASNSASSNRNEFDFPLFDQPSPSPGNARPPEFSRHAREDRQTEASLFAEIDDDLFEDLPPHPESLLVKLLSRPKQVALVVGFCVLASGLYAGLGWWWLLTRPAVPAAEPVSMLSLQEADAAPSKTSAFNHIQEIQAHPDAGTPQDMDFQTDPNRDAELPGTLLAQADTSTQAPAGSSSQSSKPSAPPELTGRPDPFAPLIQMNPALSSMPTNATAPQKKDVLEDLQYTGFIGNINAKNRLAVIKVSSGGATQTLIKKIGDAFTVDGERIVLKGIAKQTVQLSVAGQTRVLSLAPYQETLISTSSGSAASSSSPASGTGTTNAQAGATATNGAASAASGKPDSGAGAASSSPGAPQLQESEFP
jgi:hypothetical protein